MLNLFDQLGNCLSAAGIKYLDVDDQQHVVIQPNDSSPKQLNPEKINLIKQQFVRCIEYNPLLIATTLEESSKEVELLSLKKRQIIFLEKLNNSPFAAVFFNSFENSQEYLEDQNNQYTDMVLNFKNRFKAFTSDRMNVNEINTLKKMGYYRMQFATEKTIKAEIELSLNTLTIKEKETKSIEMAAYCQKKFPEVEEQLASLSDQDKKRFYLLTYVPDFEIKPNIVKTTIEQTLYSYVDACCVIDRYEDETLKKRVKEFIFQANDWQNLLEIIEWPQNVIAKNLFLIEKLYSQNNFLFFTNPITQLIEAVSYLEPEQKPVLLELALDVLSRFVESYQKMPRFSEKTPFFHQLDSLRLYPEIFKELLDLAKCSSLLDVVGAMPAHVHAATAVLKRIDPVISTEFINLWDSDPFPALNFKGVLPSVKIDYLFILSLFNHLSPSQQQEGVALLIEWIQKAPAKLENHVLGLFQQSADPTTAFDQFKNFMLALRSLANEPPEIQCEQLQQRYPALYEAAFNFMNNPHYWRFSEWKMKSQHPHVMVRLETWLSQLTGLSFAQIQSWDLLMPTLRPDFKEYLALLIRVSATSPYIFERIVTYSTSQESIQIFKILLNLYRDEPITKLYTLFAAIERYPDVLPNLTAVLKLNPQNPKGFEGGAAALIRKLEKFDRLTLDLLLIEKNQEKLLAFCLIYQQNKTKVSRLFRLEGAYSFISQNTTNGSNYLNFDERHLKALEEAPNAVDLLRKQKDLSEIPWNEIPAGLWKKDPEALLKLLVLKQNLKSKLSLFTLLNGILSDGKQAVAYQLLALNHKKKLSLMTFDLIASANQRNLTFVHSYLSIIAEDAPVTTSFLSFIERPPWKPVRVLVDKFSGLYQLPERGSLEQKLQMLPLRVKIAFLTLFKLCLEDETLIEPLSSFLTRFPQMPLFDLLIKLLEQPGAVTKHQLIALFLQMDACVLSPDQKEQTESSILSQVIECGLEKLPSELPSQLELALTFNPTQLKIAYDLLKKDKDLFILMMKLCQRLGDHTLIAANFSSEIEHFITDPEFAKTVKKVGLQQIDLNLYKKFKGIYLKLLSINPNHAGIEPLLRHEKNGELLQQLDLSAYRQPNIILEHLMTVANWNIEAANQLIRWLLKGKEYNGVGLLDLAKAGYIPEVLILMDKIEKEPEHPFYRSLMLEASSLKGDNIQRSLAELPPPAPPLDPLSLPDCSVSAVESFAQTMQKLQLTLYQSSSEKSRVLETGLSLALANALINPAGKLTKFPRNKLFAEADIPTNSDFAIYLDKTLNALEQDRSFQFLLDTISLPEQNRSPSSQIMRRLLTKPQEEVLTTREAKVAALSALLSRPRQSIGVGSCFGTSWSIITQSDSEHLKTALKDYANIIKTNGITREIINQHLGEIHYPICLLPQRMKSPLLKENLLLKARENVLASLGGTSQKIFDIHQVLMRVNLKLFDFIANLIIPFQTKPPYQQFVETFNTDFFITHAPLDPGLILSAMRITFRNEAKVIVQYEIPHPITKTLGWWQLARRQTDKTIDTSIDYLNFHTEILNQSHAYLLKIYPEHHQYIDRLFSFLKNFIQTEEGNQRLSVYKNSNALQQNNWRQGVGGIAEIVITNDLQYVGEKDLFMPLQKKMQKSSVSEMCHRLITFCETLPLLEKEKFLSEPERLHPFTIPEHSLCFKPHAILVKLAKGMTSETILEEINTPSGIMMKDLDLEKRRKAMDKWISFLPLSITSPFKIALSKIKWEEMSFEECGSLLMQLFERLHGQEPDNAMMKMLQNAFLSFLPFELLDNIPRLMIGDTNWDGEDYNNIYLIVAKNPLRNRLDWYQTKRNGSSLLAIHWEIQEGPWGIMQPISRKEKGFTSYQSVLDKS